MRTEDHKIFLAYFERGCPQSMIRGANPSAGYDARWFNPRNGTWIGLGQLTADATGQIQLPRFPDGEDWGLRLESPR